MTPTPSRNGKRRASLDATPTPSSDKKRARLDVVDVDTYEVIDISDDETSVFPGTGPVAGSSTSTLTQRTKNTSRKKAHNNPSTSNENAPSGFTAGVGGPSRIYVLDDDDDIEFIGEVTANTGVNLTPQGSTSTSKAAARSARRRGNKDVKPMDLDVEVIEIDDDDISTNPLASRLPVPTSNAFFASSSSSSGPSSSNATVSRFTILPEKEDLLPPDERLKEHRSLFTSSKPCSKCSNLIEPPRSVVIFKRGSEVIPPSLGVLLHAFCASCKIAHCRGCFTPVSCSKTCKGPSKASSCAAYDCCAEGRAIALFEVLGSFDRHYLGAQAQSESRAAHNLAERQKNGASRNAVGPGGTGYGGANTRGRGRGAWGAKHSSRPIGTTTRRGADAATHKEDELYMQTMKALAALLPSPYEDDAKTFDFLPHPSIGLLIMMSQIPTVLGGLLRNDSVTDWTAREELYQTMLTLLRRLSDSELTIPILTQRRWEMKRSIGLDAWMWGEEEIQWQNNDKKEIEKSPSLHSYFEKLTRQGQAFLAGASSLLDEKEDDESVLKGMSLCGDIVAAKDSIERAVAVIQAQCQPDAVSASDSKGKGKGRAIQPSVDTNKLYIETCEKLAFQYTIFASGGDGHVPSYHFHNLPQSLARQPKDRIHLIKELAVMATSLPPGIWVRVDEVRNDYIKAMIAGPENTPYAGGLFEFDVAMPPEYPRVPPQVHLRTTGGGTVRFNPNLYNEGKVCLSLLGTWAGSKEEQWIPYKSTFLQVLVSIQSMILVEYPYFNEPGMGQVNPKNPASVQYNNDRALNTVKWAIVDWMREDHQTGIWADVIKTHFTIREELIQKQIDKWASSDARFRSYTTTQAYVPVMSVRKMGQPKLPTGKGMDLIAEYRKGMQKIRSWAV